MRIASVFGWLGVALVAVAIALSPAPIEGQLALWGLLALVTAAMNEPR